MDVKRQSQRGVSLTGLLLFLIVFGCAGLLVARILPAYMEYVAIRNAIEAVRSAGTVREIQAAFDKQVSINNVSAISGKDLEISKNGDRTEISFAYQKKIPLMGPASLLLDYTGSTDKNLAK